MHGEKKYLEIDVLNTILMVFNSDINSKQSKFLKVQSYLNLHTYPLHKTTPSNSS